MALVITNGQSARDFSISRISRIVPLYWALTTCLLFVAALYPELLKSTTANLTNYIKSLFFIPYFKEDGNLRPMLAVGWTLNYEMFFYFCIWIAITLSRKYFVLLGFILLIASYIVLGNLIDNKVMNTFFGSSLPFEFIFGILGFYIYRRFQSTKIYIKVLIVGWMSCKLPFFALNYCILTKKQKSAD